MNTMKTKDASVHLGISQTTVKRWASHYPSSFQKDHLGHYIFSEYEFNLLQYIKDQIELGNPLDQIELPINPNSTSVDASEIELMSMDEPNMISRIYEVERSLHQKADEVVSAQVRQHRTELEELRQVVAQLAATVETMQKKNIKPVSQREALQPSSLGNTPGRARKKRFFRFFF